MPPPKRNDKLVVSLQTDFVQSYTPTTAWGNAISGMLMLPQLRGFWPFSSVDENTDVYDLSGQGRVMTNGSSVSFGSYGIYPYADFVRASNDYFYRTDEAGLSITADLTLGCWCEFDAPATGNNAGLLGKYLGTGNQRSYLTYKSSTDIYTFIISVDGTATKSVSSSVTYVASQWHFIVGRYIPSTSLDIFVDGTWDTDVTSIPAGIFDSTAAFEFGRFNATNYHDGKIALPFICATSVSNTMIANVWQQTRALFGR